MGNIFAITTTPNNIKADASSKTNVIFTVTNTSHKPIRGIARAKAFGDTQQDWLDVEGETERDFGPGGTQQFTVNFTSPAAGPTPGEFPFRMDMESATNPDEEFTEGPTVTIETAAAPAPVVKKSFPLWIILVIAAAVLLLVIGLILFLVLRKGDTVSSNSNVTAANVATPVPAVNTPRFVGVGTDKLLWTKTSLESPWIQVPNSGAVTAVAVMPDGTIVGLGTDLFLWTRATLTSGWVQVPNSAAVIGVAVLPNGSLIGIGTDKLLWTRENLQGTGWRQVPNSGGVISIAVMPDGTILGVGTDLFLWRRATLNSGWVQVPNSAAVTSVAVMRDGSILGVGTDKFIWRRANLNSGWVQVPNSAAVLSVAELK